MRDVLTTLLDFLGAALVVAGVSLVSTPGALVLGGVLVLVASWKAAR